MENKKKRRRQGFFKRNMGLIYISPWILGFLLLQLYPFVASFCYSFTNYNMFSKPQFVGLANYIRLFTVDPDFWNSLTATLKYAAMTVPAKLVFALIVAMILNVNLKGVNFFRTVYYLPSILGGSVAISALWKLMFMKEGMINTVLSMIHVGPIDWLGSTAWAMPTISLLQVWQFGSSMVLFLAALKQVPQELYEAASVDGSTPVKNFFTITLPMITPIVFFNMIMQTINALQNFTSGFVVTGGGPLKSTYLLGMKLYDDAFGNGSFKMGYASATSWIMLLLIFIFTLLIFKSSDAWVYYEDEGEF